MKLSIKKVILYAYLILGAAAVMLPYWWMLSTSLKHPPELFQVGINFLPSNPTLDNYAKILSSFPIIRWLINSFIICTLVLATNMTLTVAAGYAFARLRFWGRDILFFVYLGAMMVPLQVRFIPTFLIVLDLGWMNTYQGIASLLLIDFFGIFLIRQFMMTLPKELEDAARIDGCGWFQTLWRIIIPNCLPALATLGILIFNTAWNDFMWPLIVINDMDIMTAQVGLAVIRGSAASISGGLMAATTITALPVLMLYIALQKMFNPTLVMTGSKA